MRSRMCQFVAHRGTIPVKSMEHAKSMCASSHIPVSRKYLEAVACTACASCSEGNRSYRSMAIQDLAAPIALWVLL